MREREGMIRNAFLGILGDNVRRIRPHRLSKAPFCRKKTRNRETNLDGVQKA